MSRLRFTARVTCSAVAVSLALSGCIGFGRRDKPPDTLVAYLDALVAKDFTAAYRQTQLREIVASPGVSFEHFRAFHIASPLRGYEFEHVARLDRRDIESVNEPGEAVVVVDVRLTYADGARVEILTVEGEALPRVVVDPDPVLLDVRGPTVASIDIDGVPTGVEPQAGTGAFLVLLLRGRHTVGVPGRAPVVLRTEPLSVESGPARVADGRVVVD